MVLMLILCAKFTNNWRVKMNYLKALFCIFLMVAISFLTASISNLTTGGIIFLFLLFIVVIMDSNIQELKNFIKLEGLIK